MKAQKWDYKKHEYDPYDLPENCRLYDNDLSRKVACCQCGKEEDFGMMYTSKEIHTKMGLGYPVCETCYELEIKRDKESK